MELASIFHLLLVSHPTRARGVHLRLNYLSWLIYRRGDMCTLLARHMAQGMRSFPIMCGARGAHDPANSCFSNSSSNNWFNTTDNVIHVDENRKTSKSQSLKNL